MQRNRQDAGEPDEISIGRQDRQIAPFRYRADQTIRIRSLNASSAARIEMLGRAFEIFPLEGFIQTRPEVIAQPLQGRVRPNTAEQFLSYHADHGYPAFFNERTKFIDGWIRRRASAPER